MMLPSIPSIRSHELSRFEHSPNNSNNPTSEPKKAKTEDRTFEMYKLVKNMPVIVRVPHSDAFNLHVSSDIDLESAALDSSWFVNVVVTFVDRNGTVIYHEV